jgi:hypothetical protein
MSSDSGESHTSAPHDEDGDVGGESIAPDSPIETNSIENTDGAAEKDTAHEGEQALDVLGGASNGLTFARHRRAQEEDSHELESVSDIPLRPAARRPGSPESISTPDDTPSIQVGLLQGHYGDLV